jgi:predicted nucleic acid-binding protein
MIFLDTGAFHAMYVKNDKYHDSAIRIKREMAINKYGAAITTNYILNETFTLLRSSVGIIQSIKLGELIRNSKILHVIWIDDVIEEKAWRIFSTYRDRPFSFTDCTSFVVMQDMTIQNAFTYDLHFSQMKFIVIGQ